MARFATDSCNNSPCNGAAVALPTGQVNTLDKEKETQNPAEMQTVKTSTEAPGETPNDFEIVGVEVKGVPSVRVSNQPVQQPTPTPSPTPPPPPPPPPPGS